MEEEIIRSPATRWKGLKTGLRKTGGIDPIDKKTMLVKEYIGMGIDPAKILQGETYRAAYKRIKGVVV